MNDYIIRVMSKDGYEYASFAATGNSSIEALETVNYQGAYIPTGELLDVVTTSVDTGLSFTFEFLKEY